MAEDDWDLYAVVRGCNSAAATSTAATEAPPPAAPNTASSEDTTLSSLATLTFKEENDPFSFPNLVQPNPTTHTFQELQQLLIPFAPTTDTDQKQQQNQLKVFHKSELQLPQSSSAINLVSTQVQTPRSRKRKVHQKRMVCRVTAENLSADLWAWRKYGQKPIKGSPYPRNYYRCSSSKGCAARKQVERSVTEPDTFVMTYTGDHSHPPPTHRNSLAGSTRNKPSTIHSPRTQGSDSPGNPGSSSSSLSPIAAFTTPPDNEEAAEETESANKSPSPDPDLQTQEGSDDDILIPNMSVMTEDIFLGLHQFGGGGGSSGNSSGGSSPTSQPGFALARHDNPPDNSRLNPG